MDYLVENVVGTIPQYEELSPMGKAVVDTAGVEAAQSSASADDEATNEESEADAPAQPEAQEQG